MKKLLFALTLLLAPSAAFAQCNGIFPNNTVCGNVTGSGNLPRPTAPSSFNNSAGGSNGQIQYNNGGVPGGFTAGGDLTFSVPNFTVNTFGTAQSGKVPASGGGTVNFLRADGTWAPVALSVDAQTGAFTTGNGIDSTSKVIELTPARRTLPTISTVTTTAHSGGFAANASGTYTTPANVLWLEIEIIGGGAGGSGSGASGAAGASCWNTTGAACTTPVYSAGGGNASVGGAIAGSATCNILALAGQTGGGGGSTTASTSSAGGAGGNSMLIGAGVGVTGNAGGAATADTGSGGAGGGVSAVISNSATGGGAGATCRVIINSPAATYTYAVGALSAGAIAGGAIAAGGSGAGGRIRVLEHYGT